MQKMTTFLMFEDRTQEAIDFYLSVFKNSKVVNQINNETDKTDAVQFRVIKINDMELILFDSPVHHEFTFTPAISLFINCESEEEINNLFEKITSDGSVLMPLDIYPFAKKYAWVADKFGVTWQLSFNE